MLSRVAESLYWIGRYLERAENVTRLLMVTTEVAVEIEGLDDALAQSQWDELLAAVGADGGPPLRFSQETGLALPYVRWLLLDESNPVSVRRSLAQARENGRTVREALTLEVFLDLNESHRELDGLNDEVLGDPVRALDEVGRTHRAIRTILGAIEQTLSRDEGWNFMKLGEAFERTQRTLWVLGTRLPGLESLGARDLPLFYGLWRALLRSMASIENYRALHGAHLDPDSVLRFLLFEPTAPRSVRCGISRIGQYLQRLPSGADSEDARRIVGRLDASLRYDADEILANGNAVSFCTDTSQTIAKAHDAVARGLFRV
jgi:uncharacterized alpha-E superfamily protein